MVQNQLISLFTCIGIVNIICKNIVFNTTIYNKIFTLRFNETNDELMSFPNSYGLPMNP